MAKASPLSRFHPPVAEWFRSALGEPTRAQALGWPPVLAGKSTLLLAPTGSGKTLAAFLAAIERLMWSPVPDKLERCRVLYVSPLKALAVDVERNLRSPIAGIAQVAARMGVSVHLPTVEIRTGDTPAKDRARMLRAPPDVLITTPESLYLLLTSQAKETLSSIDTVIVDEIHSLVPTKRGAHLFLSLERLESIRTSKSPLQRIGLSATQRPLDEVARLLGGLEGGVPREVAIVDAGERKEIELRVEVPDVDMGRLGELEPIPSGPASAGPSRRSIWPEIHKRIVELIREHRSTMVFVNSRRLAERLASALNELAGEELALAHHGSVAREKRAIIEDRLKRGDLPAIVATSSLELGIDMGAVGLVIQVEAPASVASGLQRVGRACHEVGGVPRGVILPKHRGDLLAAAAAAASMKRGEVEETFYPRNPLDVLAQQIVAITSIATAPIAVDDLYALVRRAAPFAELPHGAFEGILDMLAGRYPSDEFAELRPRITWDRVAGTVRAREGAKRLAITNGGTIPDRGLYGVFLSAAPGGKSGASAAKEKPGGRRVGELDEEMVFELREGEVFLLGASSWRADEITHDRVLVSPAAGQPGKMPFGHGDRPGRPRPFGERIGELARKLSKLTPPAAEALLREDHGLDEHAARNLALYIAEQIEAAADVPSDKTVIVERFIDEIGDWRVCVLTPFGTRLHAPWSTAIAARLRQAYPGEIDTHYTDDGMAFRIPACDEPPPAELFFPASDEVTDLVTHAVGDTPLFASRFRECAGRALLLPRRHPTKRTPLWAQRKRASDLLAVASRHPSFPIVLETYRECLRDVFDLPGLVDVLRRVETRRIRVATVDSRTPSPFAGSVMFSYVASFIYDGDAPLAERRAQALSIDHAQLRELLGEVELRQLLDAEAIEEHERYLQRLVHPAKHADGVHDMLLALGPLSEAEVRARAMPSDAAPGWLRELVKERRVVPASIGGNARFAAAEDTARLRDALGFVPPRGLPDAFLEPVARPLEDLVLRYARTHVPFPAATLATRLGLAISTTEQVVDRLVREGRLVSGEFLPHGAGRELCDPEVLSALRRKSLAKLRREVEPVDADAYARFLVEWQGLTRKRRGPDALLAVVAQLEGAPLVASTLDAEILPARIEGYRSWDLDALCASGEVVWAGVEPIGPSDGRIALYLADHESTLAAAPPAPVAATHELAGRIRALLGRRGAVFFAEIVRELGGFPHDALEALWDLVWAGEVTNDTLEPLRSRLRAISRGSDARARTRKERPGSRNTARRASRAGPPGSEGRWSLRASRWATSDASEGASASTSTTHETTRRTALARALLDRYGIVTREAVHAEAIAGGFSAVYEVLKAMEDAGRVRRGYFIAGRGGTQFALPGADDRLRARRESDDAPVTMVLAATDPANPFGASLPWPDRVATEQPALGEETRSARPQRAAGALVVIRDGALLAWVGRSEQALLTFFPESEPARSVSSRALATALAELVTSGRRRAVLLATIDGAPAEESDVAPDLFAVGFIASSKGLFKRAPASHEAWRRRETEPPLDADLELDPDHVAGQ